MSQINKQEDPASRIARLKTHFKNHTLRLYRQGKELFFVGTENPGTVVKAEEISLDEIKTTIDSYENAAKIKPVLEELGVL